MVFRNPLSHWGRRPPPNCPGVDKGWQNDRDLEVHTRHSLPPLPGSWIHSQLLRAFSLRPFVFREININHLSSLLGPLCEFFYSSLTQERKNWSSRCSWDGKKQRERCIFPFITKEHRGQKRETVFSDHLMPTVLLQARPITSPWSALKMRLWLPPAPNQNRPDP